MTVTHPRTSPHFTMRLRTTSATRLWVPYSDPTKIIQILLIKMYDDVPYQPFLNYLNQMLLLHIFLIIYKSKRYFWVSDGTATFRNIYIFHIFQKPEGKMLIKYNIKYFGWKNIQRDFILLICWRTNDLGVTSLDKIEYF